MRSMKRLLPLVILLIGCQGTSIIVHATPTPAEQTFGRVIITPGVAAPHTESGEGMKNTAPFALSAGDYLVHWTATDTGSTNVGCFHSAVLKNDSGYREDVGSGDPGGGKTVTDETWLYGVPTGRFHLEVISGCHWTISIFGPA